MKKLAIVLLVAVASFCLVNSVFAGNVAPGGALNVTMQNL